MYFSKQRMIKGRKKDTLSILCFTYKELSLSLIKLTSSNSIRNFVIKYIKK